MKPRIIVLYALMAALALGATPQQFVAAGVSWNQFASPQINGLLVYAKRLTSNNFPTYSYSAVNLLSVSRSPFRLLTTVETGVAQHLTTFGPFRIYGVGMAGLAAADTNSGYVVSGGGLALAGIGKGWRVGPYLRVLKSSLSERQWAAGVMVGWGE